VQNMTSTLDWQLSFLEAKYQFLKNATGHSRSRSCTLLLFVEILVNGPQSIFMKQILLASLVQTAGALIASCDDSEVRYPRVVIEDSIIFDHGICELIHRLI
jgi:hypothetical protein